MNKALKKVIREYLQKIGKKGGEKSKRKLLSKEATRIARIRWDRQKRRDNE